MEILRSQEDDSVNYVFSGAHPGFFEARYVRRSPKYLAIYLSSQSGCKQACRMCHLTATGQTALADETPEGYLAQAMAVFRHYDDGCPKAEIAHFNFMARGEALANSFFLNNGKELLERLGAEALKRQLFPRFLVSTVMPKSFFGKSLSGLFPIIHPEIYYSIYSVREEFRKRWLPKAMPVAEALTMLKEYQENTKQIIKLHWAFIEGENDSEDDVALMCHRVRSAGLRVDVAIVRYNPYSADYGRESGEEVIDHNVRVIEMHLPFSKVKKITRVGRDVKASCGMFVEPDFGKP